MTVTSLSQSQMRRLRDTTTEAVWMLEGCVGGKAEITQTRIGPLPFQIGRSSDSHFVLPSRNVSKRHAEIIVGGNAVFVRDLGSSNGTYVNGVRITAATPLGLGDLVQFADLEFRLMRTHAVEPDHTAVSDSPEKGWLISRLHEVINERRFEMVFQPIVLSGDLKLVAFEALVRGKVPGLESPYQLFSAATQLNLEERVSQLCREAAVECMNGYAGTQALFINTHPNEYLGRELVASLNDLRVQAGSRQIVLEIHEAAVPELNVMREFRRAMDDLGIQLAYDDFGAGQSRLLELAEVTPHYLKFDRSLLKDLPQSSLSHHSLVQTLVRVAQDRGILPLAEGLDDPQTIEICRQMGFTHLQGFELGRPAALPEV